MRAPILPDYAHPLVVRDLAAGYGSRQVLAGIDLTVAHGEVRVILGGSGGGKTTLLRHLVGLAEPQRGHVELLGVDLPRADEPLREAVLGRVGMLFQAGALLGGMSVVDNVALPLRERTTLRDAAVLDIAWMKLGLVGLTHAGHLLPSELSGGMRKRAALARAMALDPDILFCDEPSAGLDPVMAADLDRLILDLRDQFGMAVVVVTHELPSIHAIADRVTMLAAGCVIADGTLAAVEALRDPIVRAFFERRATQDAARLPSVLDVLRQGAPAAPGTPP